MSFKDAMYGMRMFMTRQTKERPSMYSKNRMRLGKISQVLGGAVLSLSLLASCSAQAAQGGGSANTGSLVGSQVTSTNTTSSPGEAVNLVDVSSLFSERDLDPSYVEAQATTISLTGSGAEISGKGAEADGSTITITAEGTYVVSGTLSDGQLVVDAGDTDRVQIVLKDASIATSSASALYVANADKVFLTLADGSTNALSATGESYEDDSSTVDGAVFSHDDLTINGTGSLEVSSSQGHGIVGKDEVTLVSGTLTVSATGHAVQANNSIAIADGTYQLTGGTDALHAAHSSDETLGFIYIGGGELTLNAASDGMDASSFVQVDDGTIDISAGDDGMHAEYDLAINGGTINIPVAHEGIEGSTISITGGTTYVVADDDGLNAAGVPGGNYGDFEADPTAILTITGGKLEVDAQGDGIDSNGDLIVSGGETYVTGSVNGGNGALDYVGEGRISGGIFVAVSAVGMEQNFGSTSTQGTILVDLDSSVSGTVELKDSAGSVLASYEPTREYQSVVISAPGVGDSGSYTLTCAGTEQTLEMNGFVYGQASGMGGMGGPGMDGGMGGPGGPGGQDGMGGTAPDGGMGGGTPPNGGQGAMGGTPPNGGQGGGQGATSSQSA